MASASNLAHVHDYEEVGSGRHENLRFWLRLLTCTMLIETKIRSRLEQQFDVTLPQFDLMAQLDRVPDGLTMSGLSERLMVSNGNVTGIVKRLIAEKLVDRQTSKTDRRAFVVRLSRKGQLLFREMANTHEQWINELFAEIQPQDVELMMGLLARTKDAVRKSGGDDPAKSKKLARAAARAAR
ncbi:MAG: MarR family winged helix-turn-helix transcriptional regulator [Rhodospirillaceae bacterium]